MAKQERVAGRGWCCGRLSKGGGSLSLARGGKPGEQGKERLWLAAEGEEPKCYGCERDRLVREKIGSSCSGGGRGRRKQTGRGSVLSAEKGEEDGWGERPKTKNNKGAAAVCLLALWLLAKKKKRGLTEGLGRKKYIKREGAPDCWLVFGQGRGQPLWPFFF